MKENTCMNITGKRPMPMLRNIDVINGIAERCREISLISTEIDTLCEMKQQNILDLPDSDERGLITVSTSMLFRQYFYDVVLYSERKPEVYPKYDAHIKRVLSFEFFKRIIVQYLKE